MSIFRRSPNNERRHSGFFAAETNQQVYKITMPEVTVSMPAYNTERYIGAAIQSVLRQTELDFELLVVDDGSTDSTEAVARSFDDPRIRVFRTGTNRGASFCHNLVIAQSAAPFIAHIESDDLVRPGALKKMVAALALRIVDKFSIKLVPEFLYCFRVNPGSASQRGGYTPLSLFRQRLAICRQLAKTDQIAFFRDRKYNVNRLMLVGFYKLIYDALYRSRAVLRFLPSRIGFQSPSCR